MNCWSNSIRATLFSFSFLSWTPQEAGYTLVHDQCPKLLLRAGEYEAIVQDLHLDGIIMLDGKQWHFKDLRPRHIVLSRDIVDFVLRCLKARQGSGIAGGNIKEGVKIR